MKKKVLAFLLASTMVIEPFSVASAADFSDGTGQDVVQFSDDAEDVPEVETNADGVDQFSTDAVGEGESSSKPLEDAIQMGNDVWMTYDDSTRTVTISGTGNMWDYLQDGATLDGEENPLKNQSMDTLIIGDQITHVSDYLLYKEEGNLFYGHGVKNIQIGKNVKSIGKYAFHCEASLNEVKFMGNDIQELGENCFRMCRGMNNIILPDSINKLGDGCFAECTGLKTITLPDSLKEISDYCFYECESLKEINIPDNVSDINYHAFQNCSGLKKVTFSINSKLEGIEYYAFDHCSRLEEINLPDRLREIGMCAFSGCSKLNNVIVPSSVRIIPRDAFLDCSNLSKITLNEGLVGISERAFEQCVRLQEISIPQSVKRIGYNVENDEDYCLGNPFIGCDNLNKIYVYSCSVAYMLYNNLPEDQRNKITFKSLGEGSHQFTAEKVQIKEPTCTEKGIKAYRCEICGATKDEEEIPAYDHKWDGGVITKQATETEEGVRTYTCRRCNKTKTEPIPKLSAINLQIDENEQYWNGHYQYRFWCTSNKDVTYYVECVKKDSGQPVYDDTKQDGKIKENGGRWINVDITDEDAVDIYIFATNTNGNYVYKKVTPNYDNRPQKPVYQVGDNVTASVDGDTLILAGTGSTYNNGNWYNDNKNNIKHIIVRNGVTSIGDWLFGRFDSISTVELPTTLISIGESAFYGCCSLQNIVIPEGVTEIGYGIFNDCNSLKSISFPSTLNTIPHLGGIGEDDGLNIENVIINKGIKKIGNNAFANLKNLKNITIPDSVTSIGEYAFRDCTELTNLLFPDSITKIEYGAFQNCTSLDKIVLPNNLISLGNDVFENCNIEITFPSSLKYIPCLGDNAVKKITIPEGVEIIDDNAFSNSYSLKEIVLPLTIISIGMGAFYGTGLETFTCPSNITRIPGYAFDSTNLSEFLVPDKVTEIDDCAFYNCTNLKKITIPDTVTYIGKDVFKNCRNIEIYGKRDSFAERYAYINNIKFVSGQYKVVFKDNGRTVNTYYIDEGGSVLTPPTLKEKPGYTLSWDADYTNIQEDMVINAVWTKKDNGGGNTTIIVSPSETSKYTVTFKDRGKIVKTEKVKSGDAAEYPYINRNGYELSWDKDFSKVTANITVNAVWTVIKPNKVTSLTAEVQKNSIDLSWDRAENTDYYLVYRKATSDTEYKQIKKTTKILWTDEDVEPGTEYSYKVVGVCSVDGKKYQGADSDVVTAKIGTPQIGDVYSVGDLKYKVTGAKEVSVIGLAKEEVEIKIPSAVSISGKAYKVTSVQAKAFYQNEDIVSIAIGNNVTYVGKYAFYQCPNLEAVKFGKRVSVISTCAFTQCPNLENVTLPSSIRRIGAKAFYQCTSIKVLKINGSVLEYVGKKGLAVNKSVTLRLPKKVYTRYKKLIKVSGVYSKTKFVKF